MAKLVVEQFGTKGVCVDKNPLELDDAELTLGQNAMNDPSSGRSTLRKRPGLVAFNQLAAAGVVLGGVDVPLQDLSASGTHWMYIARNPVS
jgi:hypothetical protein